MSQLTEQQREAVYSIDKNVLVSAGAGSGKTHVLVERYIEVLRSNPELTVADIVAVTFTKKAASEMRTRLKARFQALKEESQGEESQRWLLCVADIDGARIGTIHSLCDSILKSFPVEGGVDPKFEVLDDIERAELCEDSINEALRDAISTRNVEHDLLDLFSIDEVKGWLLDILGSSLQFGEVISAMGDTSDEAMQERFEKLLLWARKRAVCQIVSDQNWSTALAFVQENPWGSGTDLEVIRQAYAALAEGIDRASLEPTITEEMWSYVYSLHEHPSPGNKGGKDAMELRHRMKDLKSAVEKAVKKVPSGLKESDREAFHLIRSFISLAKRTIEIYERKKKIVHKLDYDDLIRYTFDALDQPGSPARQHFNDSLRAILVDEFQDTNATQARLVASLAGEKTRLFLIGDDKQSIYKFQGADVSNFNEWKNALCGSPSSVAIDFLQGEKNVIPLNKSFRSHPDLVNGVNAIFADLLDPGADPQIYRASFESLDAHRERVVDTERTEVLFFDSSLTENSEQKKGFETELICQWIEEKVRLQMPIQLKDGSASRPAKFGDFAILVQKNDHFAPLEEALTRHTIPFVTLGGKSFLMRQEVFDIENLLRFLDNEFDSHSLLGALRSPIFSITDDIVHQLVTDAGNPKNPHLWQLLCRVSDEKRPGFEVCRQAVAHLRKLKESAQLRTLGELIREILTLTDYDTVLLSSKNGRQRSRNLWKLVQLATANESLSPGEFARRLSLMREHKVKQADAPLQTDDVVKLMTIHASKGLEFPVVILPFLSSKIDPRYKKLLFHKQYGIAMNTDRSVSASREKDQNTPSWFQLVKLVDNDMEAEEKKRLLYVAMTRPRDHLALFIDAQTSRFNSFSTWLFDHMVPSDYAGEERVSFDLGAASKVAIRRYEPIPKLPAEVESLAVIEELDEAKKVLRLDLIEPILDSEAVLRAPTSRRITPGKHGVQLDARLVGTYFHSLMEHMLVRLEKPQRWLFEEVALSQGDWASHPEVVAHLVKQGERWIDKFYDSDLFLLMKNARRRLHEIPYFSYVDEGLEDKRPDLLIEDKDGAWHLVDYKIDSFPIAEIDKQAAEHLPQMLGYVRDLRSITGINCTAHLFFANHGVLHKLKAEVLST